MQAANVLFATLATLGAPVLVSIQRVSIRPAPTTVHRADIQRDLELVARIEGKAPAYSWWPLSIAVEIVNRSEKVSYPIVMPGDGSDAGWREPHVYFTTEVLADGGQWTEFRPPGLGRCGNYDANWLDEVVVLTPGTTRRLSSIYPPRLPPSGKLRIRAHYVYSARPPRPDFDTPDPPQPTGELGAMLGVEPFELASPPIELVLAPPEHTRGEIERDLSLELTRAGRPRLFSWEPVAVHVKLSNRSQTTTYPVVRPSFVRSVQRYEPQVLPRAELDRGDGQWRAAEPLMGGFYDGDVGGPIPFEPHPDWRPRIIALAPGQSIEFELPSSSALYNFEGAGEARFALDYRYLATVVADANGLGGRCPESLGAMAAVPPFLLHSNEITWSVRSPLTIEVLPREDRDPARHSALSDNLRVLLRNCGDEAIEISSVERPSKLEISVDGLRCGVDTFDARGTLVLGPLVLPPHGEASLLEDPSIDPATIPRLAPAARSGTKATHVEALLHRAEWLHPFRAEWRAGG